MKWGISFFCLLLGFSAADFRPDAASYNPFDSSEGFLGARIVEWSAPSHLGAPEIPADVSHMSFFSGSGTSSGAITTPAIITRASMVVLSENRFNEAVSHGLIEATSGGNNCVSGGGNSSKKKWAELYAPRGAPASLAGELSINAPVSVC